MGWLTGLEPATPGVTVQCSTIELQPPYLATAGRGRGIYTIPQDGAIPFGLGAGRRYYLDHRHAGHRAHSSAG